MLLLSSSERADFVMRTYLLSVQIMKLGHALTYQPLTRLFKWDHDIHNMDVKIRQVLSDRRGGNSLSMQATEFTKDCSGSR